MKKILFAFAAAIALTALSVPVKADILVFTTTLSGANEVPAVNSPGTGNAVVTVDGNTMTVSATFSGLLTTTATGLPSATTAAHIHCCTPPGANAGVATAVPSFPGFPLGVTSGTFFNTFDLTLASTYNPAFVTAQGGTVAGAQAAFLAGLQGGQTYFNIHTTAFGGGEIRGQLQAVPEPATMILLGTGLAAVAGRKLRRRRRE
ncbi:MAG: CHRD domain-containing protein [Pyrinomonadaceae bacterium]|nr:CHRD domain-containing protein [Pyrinomonadaceae bacterium]